MVNSLANWSGCMKAFGSQNFSSFEVASILRDRGNMAANKIGEVNDLALIPSG